MAGFLFWFRVFLYVAGLLLWGVNIAVQNPGIVVNAKSSFVGVNLFWIGLALVGSALWMSWKVTPEKEAAAEKTVTAWLYWLFAPIRFIGRCLKGAIWGPAPTP